MTVIRTRHHRQCDIPEWRTAFPIPVTLNSAARTITFTTPIGGDLTGNTFTYTISTASGTSTASVNVSIMPINTAIPVYT